MELHPLDKGGASYESSGRTADGGARWQMLWALSSLIEEGTPNKTSTPFQAGGVAALPTLMKL
jgi:hypothetical protein